MDLPDDETTPCWLIGHLPTLLWRPAIRRLRSEGRLSIDRCAPTMSANYRNVCCWGGAALGHQARFRRPPLIGNCRFDQETFGRGLSTGWNAPQAVLVVRR